MQLGSIESLHRYPVKSMQGERLERLPVTAAGVAGDRAFAVLDRSDGRLASAKHPRKWGCLLELSASYTDEPTAEPNPGALLIEFPDGLALRGDSPRLADELGRFTGRDVALVAEPPSTVTSEAVWPDIEGIMPTQIREGIRTGETDEGDTLSVIPMGSPTNAFVDAAPMHLITTATLRRLAELAPETSFDVRRYRPNVLVELPVSDFVENGWDGSRLHLGREVALQVTAPTVRCVMTTLAQRDLPADRATLRTLARENRLDVPQFGGAWACAGVYADVVSAGTVAIGDSFRAEA